MFISIFCNLNRFFIRLLPFSVSSSSFSSFLFLHSFGIVLPVYNPQLFWNISLQYHLNPRKDPLDNCNVNTDNPSIGLRQMPEVGGTIRGHSHWIRTMTSVCVIVSQRLTLSQLLDARMMFQVCANLCTVMLCFLWETHKVITCVFVATFD